MSEFRINVVVDPREARRGIGEVDKGLRGLLSLIAQLAAAKKLIDLVDTFQNIQNKLRTVTDGEVELAKVTKELLDISNRTRQSFEATASLYSRVALAAKELGIEQDKLLVFTESLNKAIALSGATSEEAQAGLIQLSQGIASGTLRGDELRSVLEQLPVVADVIAKELGVTRGELRALGQDGKISAEAIVNAFVNAREELDGRFGKSVTTIGQALTLLSNKFLELVGTLAEDTGVGQAFIDLINLLTDILRLIQVLTGTFKGDLSPAVKDFAAILTSVALAFGVVLIANPFGAIAAAIGAVLVAMAQLDNLVKDLNQAYQDQERGALSSFGLLGQRIQETEKSLKKLEDAFDSGTNTTDVVVKKIEELRAKLAALRNEQTKAIQATEKHQKINREIAATLAGLTAKEEQLRAGLSLTNAEREVANRLLTIQQKLQANGVNVTAEQRAEFEARLASIQALEDQTKVLDDIQGPMEEFERRLKAAKILLDAGRISAEDYAKAIQGANGDVQGPVAPDIADPSSLPEVSQDPFAGTLESLQRETEQMMLANQGLEERARLVTILHALSDQGRSISAEEQASLEEEIALQARLRDEAQIAANAEADARARKEEALRAETEVLTGLEGPQARLNELQDAATRLYEAGRISADQYTEAMLRLQIASLQTSESAADGFTTGFAKVRLEMNDLAGLAENTVVNAFNSAEDSLTSFLTTGEAGFSDFVDGIVADLARLLARQALGGLINLFAPGAGEAGGILGSLFGGPRAGGGDVDPNHAFLVGERGPELFVPPSQGTIVPHEQTMAAANAGAATTIVQAAPAQVNLQVVNVTDPDEVTAALDTPGAEQKILNVISKNRTRVKRDIS